MKAFSVKFQYQALHIKKKTNLQTKLYEKTFVEKAQGSETGDMFELSNLYRLRKARIRNCVL